MSALRTQSTSAYIGKVQHTEIRTPFQVHFNTYEARIGEIMINPPELGRGAYYTTTYEVWQDSLLMELGKEWGVGAKRLPHP